MPFRFALPLGLVMAAGRDDLAAAILPMVLRFGPVAAYAAFIWELRLEVVVTGEHPRLQLLSGGLPFAGG